MSSNYAEIVIYVDDNACSIESIGQFGVEKNLMFRLKKLD